MNNVSIIGRMASAVEIVPITGTHSNLVKFAIAVDSRVNKATNQKETWFFDCEAWDDVAKRINDFVSKGDRVGITGHLKQDKFIRKDGSKASLVKIVVSSCEFLDSHKIENSSASNEIKDEDVPF